ncbi:glycosyltransferase [Eggerthellaceae bacterium zg-893]|nr:glycosyltransferase [Eggerthellaceae bacterium zg-893]
MAENGSAPSVSLLVPVYNVERYLAECLDSVVAQTFGDFEVVCVNDGSTDGSRDIIERYLADPRFRVIDKANSGYGASMNRGLREARGKYVAILESDDFMEPGALERLVGVAEDAGAQVVKARFWFYWSAPVPCNEPYRFYGDVTCGRPFCPMDDEAIFHEKPSIWSALYRRDFLEANDIRFLETPGASYQDASFNFKAWACADRVVVLDEEFVHYRQDNEASSVNSPAKVYCVCDEYAEMEAFARRLPARRDALRGILTRMRYDSYVWNIERLSFDLGRQFVFRMAEDFAPLVEDDVAMARLEPWRAERVRAVVRNPLLFFAQQTCRDDWSFVQKMRHYLRVGGPSLLVGAVRERLR